MDAFVVLTQRTLRINGNGNGNGNIMNSCLFIHMHTKYKPIISLFNIQYT